MRSLRSIVCIFLSVALTPALPGVFAQAAQTAFTCIWTGAVDNTWNTPGNWINCNGNFPQAADTASITSTAPNPSPVLNGSTTITRLDINPTGMLIIVGGARLTANMVNIHGRFSGPGEIEVLNTFHWGGVDPVNWNNDLILDNGGKITVKSGAHGYIDSYGADYYRMNNFTLENYGIIDPAEAAPYNYLYINLVTAKIDNYGTFVINGTFADPSNNSTFHNHTGGTLQATGASNIFTELLNDGVVNIANTDVSVCRGSPQNGEFKGTGSALISFGSCDGGVITPTTINFSTTSILTVPRVQIYPTTNIHGVYGPLGTTTESWFYGTVVFSADASINSFGNSLNVYGATTVNATAPVDQYDLNVSGAAGNFSYSGTINVWHELKCGGILSGGGLLRVKPGGVLRLSQCKLDAKTLENQGEAWDSVSSAGATILQGLNNASLDNIGIFYLRSGGLITGTMSMHNGGKLNKNYNTTTTIGTPFTNSGTIEILLGKIVFTGDVTLPVTTTNTIKGTLQVGELINNGTLTVEGTVDGDLTNYGTLNLKGAVIGDLVNDFRLSPGSSPGLAIVGGNFTQTGNGSLKIDLSKDGDIPVTNPLPGIDFDQLQITGTAAISGELYLVAGQTLAVESLSTFPFLTADGGVSGAFGSYLLDDMIDQSLWHLLWLPDELAVRINAFLFLPWLNR
jgi:hypothetical protein